MNARSVKAGLGEFVDVERHGKKCKKYVGKYFHDFRRTGCRDLVRSGTNEGVVMQISGHKTRTIFERYNIVSGRDLKEAAVRRTRYALEQAAEAKAVVSINQ